MNTRSTRSMIAGLFLSVLISNPGLAELVITGLWPTNQSPGVCADSPLRLTFSEPPALGRQGQVMVCRAADNQPVDVFDLNTTGAADNFGGKSLHYEPVRMAGNTVSLQLHARSLNSGTAYYVTIVPGTFQGRSGNAFAGFTNQSAWRFTTRQAMPKGRTRVVVAADGTGDFCTPQGAVDYVSDDNQSPVEIFIRKGVYEGMVYIMRDKSHLHFLGEDRKGTIIVGQNNDRFNAGRINRALVNVDADDFILENMTLRNTTPYRGSQAEALRLNGNRCVLRNDDFYSFQDTLLLSGRVYATNCYVEGDVDFIWGQGVVFFDRCEIKAVHSGYYVQARNPENSGYVFFRCQLTAAPGVERCVLARIDADRFPCSAVTFINCQMGGQVPPVGWEARGTNLAHLRFQEFQSTDLQGQPLAVGQRHPASRQLNQPQADALSDPARVLSDQDTWNPGAMPGPHLE